MEVFTKFRGLFPGLSEVTITTSRRSTPSILASAAAAVRDNRHRVQKTLVAAPAALNRKDRKVQVWEQGTPVCEADAIAAECQRLHDVEGVPYGEMACLLRCFKYGQEGATHLKLQDSLVKRGVPFTVVKGLNFMQRAACRDAVAALTLLLNPRDDAACERIAKLTEGLGDTSIDAVRAHATNLGVPMEEAMRSDTLVLGTRPSKMLRALLDTLDSLREQALGFTVPELLVAVCNGLGISARVEKELEKKRRRAESLAEGDGGAAASAVQDEGESEADTEEDDDSDASAGAALRLSQREGGAVVPLPGVLAKLQDIALDFHDSLGQTCVHEEDAVGPPSLMELCMRQLKARPLTELLPMLIARPATIVSDFILQRHRVGRTVIEEFVAHVALQATADGDGSAETTRAEAKAGADRVQVCHH